MSSGTVLVVDEDDVLRESLVAALEAEGFGVASARSAHEALAAIRAASRDARPACVVFDVMMPGMDGVEFVGELRRSFAPEPLPFTLVATSAAGHDLPAQLRTPDVGRLDKPMELTALYAAVRRSG